MIAMHTSPTATLGHSANGGLNVYVREVCRELSRRGVATDVFTRCVDEICQQVEQLAPLSRVVYLRAGRASLSKYRLVDEVPFFTDRIEDFVARAGLSYDLIYSHYWLSGLTACVLQRRLHVPWVHRAHTLAVIKNRQLAPGAHPEPEVRVDLEGQVARCADLLVVSTASEGDDLRRAYHVDPDRIAVIPPGVDLSTFRSVSKSVARLLVGHPDRRLFLFAGRLEPLKGVDVVLRAFAILVAGGGHPDVRLLVVGEDSGADGGGEKARLESLARELGVQDHVEFLGSVPHERLPTYYASAEACLMPSHSETFGLVGLEAQACGTAVVATNVAGLASVVRHGVTGFLVDGPDALAYAECMRRLLDEPGLAEGMGRRGHRLAQRFSWERTADMLLERFRPMSQRVGRIEAGPPAAPPRRLT